VFEQHIVVVARLHAVDDRGAIGAHVNDRGRDLVAAR
jgi:hypothetical protein